ncbi:MAG: ribonuclease P protein component [Candidatus Omnitrophica bacterium]|nr:ribonuclease P protein component [Candidatus Omnitrophota bacterium]
MTKEKSLRKPADFKKVFKEGKRLLSPRFVLYVRDNALPQARVGISIAKIHFKLATRRNQLRRAAKETIRQEAGRFIKGCDLVVTSRASTLKPDINESIVELKELIRKLKK